MAFNENISVVFLFLRENVQDKVALFLFFISLFKVASIVWVITFVESGKNFFQSHFYNILK